MWHEAEVARRILVAEGGDARCQVHHAGNHAQGVVGERCAELRARLIGEHHVATVLRDAHVDMQT